MCLVGVLFVFSIRPCEKELYKMSLVKHCMEDNLGDVTGSGIYEFLSRLR